MALPFITVALFAQSSFPENLKLKENKKIILQKKQPEQKYQKPTPSVRERQNSTPHVRPEPGQLEQSQDKVTPWEQDTPGWDKENYDLEIGNPWEKAPVDHPETGQTPGTRTEQNVEQYPGSMPQINNDLEMEQGNSNMTGYVQPDFAVVDIARLVNPDRIDAWIQNNGMLNGEQSVPLNPTPHGFKYFLYLKFTHHFSEMLGKI